MGDFAIHPHTKLGPVSLTVSDLARARRFYAGTLGFRSLGSYEDEVALGADGQTPLLLLTGGRDARPKPPRTTGLYHFAILLPGRADLARALRRLVERRYPLQGASDHGVSEALYLADPDGNGIEIYADRPREAWPRQEGQLQMVTDRLNVEGLLGELNPGGRTGNGVPAGTRIGHVHLHVADLGRAERFYRDGLGFELTQRYPTGRGADGASALFFSAGGYHHHVGLNTWAGVGAPPPPPDAVGLRYFTVELPDEAELARLAAHLRASGISFERQDGPGAAGLRLHDPAGNTILCVSR